MRFLKYLILAVLAVAGGTAMAEKQRVVVLTDIGGADPDDQESLVHLLASLDAVDLEGIVLQYAWSPFDEADEYAAVDKVLAAYGQAWPNLRVHSESFLPEAELRAMVKHGQNTAGMKGVGEGMDSPGSEQIIAVVDASDDRPVWIAAWSGLSTAAQALWKVRATRSPAEVEAFVNKLRIYDILGQDDAGAWIVTNFPNLLYIRNKEVYGWGPSDQWIKENVQSRGPLGEAYPDRKWASEGDSPSFMYMLDNGLNQPEHVDWGGWGGKFEPQPVAGIRSMDWVERNGLDETAYDPYYMIGSAPEGCQAINKWQSDILNDFAARMLWASTPNYGDANHHPIISIGGDTSKEPIFLTAQPGETLTIDAADCRDPDGDTLAYEWIYYAEPSTYAGLYVLEGNGPKVTIQIPADATGATLHIILRLTDSGTPALSAYRRFVIH